MHVSTEQCPCSGTAEITHGRGAGEKKQPRALPGSASEERSWGIQGLPGKAQPRLWSLGRCHCAKEFGTLLATIS